MKKLLLLTALVGVGFSTLKPVDALQVIADIGLVQSAAKSEFADIKARTCPEAAGDASLLMYYLRQTAKDIDATIADQIDAAVDLAIKTTTGQNIKFTQVIGGLSNLQKSLKANPNAQLSSSQLNLLTIASLVAGVLHDKIKALENTKAITATKAGKAGFEKLVMFVNAVKTLLLSCKDAANKAKLELELADLQKNIVTEVGPDQDPFDF